MKILRCGWCGCFCDNEGRIFEASKQLVAADKAVGFEDAKGQCSACVSNDSLNDTINEELLTTS